MLLEIYHAAKCEPIAKWTLHDLRRTAATGMARLSFPPHVIDRLLNHLGSAIRGVAAVYNRFEYLEERRAALEAWGRSQRAARATQRYAPAPRLECMHAAHFLACLH
jgi:integrase